MKKIKQWWMKKIIKGSVWMKEKSDEAVALLNNNEGAAFMDLMIKIILVIVVGGLLITTIYLLFKDTLLPLISDRIKALFNAPTAP